MIVDEQTERAVALFLWRSSLNERVAAGVFHRLQRGTLLTPEERVSLDRYTQDETDHANALRACAVRHSVGRPETAEFCPFKVHEWPEHTALTFVNVAERLATPGFLRLSDFFGRYGDVDAQRAYRRIAAEEPAHIAWGRRILARCRRDPEMKRDISAFVRSRMVSDLSRSLQHHPEARG